MISFAFPRRRAAGALACLLAAGALSAGTGPSVPRLHGIVGDYGAPVRQSGTNAPHIDVSRTLDQLQAAGVTTYVYGIYSINDTGQNRSLTDWNDLPSFLSAAASRGIDVWVLLVPPTEVISSTTTPNPNYPPYSTDYAAWADAIATLADSHSNLKAFVIDDFAQNTSTFTTTYVQSVVDAAHTGHNGKLAFWPVVYFANLYDSSAGAPTSFVSTYQSLMDGLIMPYRGVSDGTNYHTDDGASDLVNEVQKVAPQLSDHVDVPSDQGEVGCYELSLPDHSAASSGAYGQVAQTFTLSSSGIRTISFWDWDDYTGATSGYLYKELWLDGQMLWQEDLAGGDASWHPVQVTTSSLASGSHTLALRLASHGAVGNFKVTVRFDKVLVSGVSLSNPSFETPVGSEWTFSQASSPTAAWQHAQPMATHDIPLAVMAYCAGLIQHDGSTDPVPTASYLDAVLSKSLTESQQGLVDGTITYLMPKPATSANGDIVVTDPNGLLTQAASDHLGWTPLNSPDASQGMISFPWSHTSAAGEYGVFSQTATLSSTVQSAYGLGFWVRDDYTGATAGYHYAQVLVNGTPAWEEDVAGNESTTPQGLVAPTGNWRYVYADLTGVMKKLVAQGTLNPTLGLQVYDRQGVGNFGINVRFNAAVPTGFTLTDPTFSGSGWTFSGSNGNWTASYPTTAP